MPSELRAEMSRSAALANPVWVDARKRNDFAAFLPVLRKNLDLRKRYIDCFEVGDEPYDIVLDDYERGMKTKEVRGLFDYLKEHQAPLVKEVAARGGNEPHDHDFAIEPQKVFELEVAPRVRLHRRGLAPRSDRASVRVRHRGHGHPHHDPLLQRAPRRPLRNDARVRARAVRAPGRPGARTLTSRARRLARHARVAEPDVGEPRRPLAAVLAPLLPAAAAALPRRARWLRLRSLVSRGERRRAVADPRRVRRGDLQPAHHPALRARAGHAGRRVPARAAPRGVEPADVGVPRDRGPERHARRPAGRPLVGRLDRLLPDLRARQPDLRTDLGEGHDRPARPLRRVRSRASSRPSATGCASTCTGTAASSHRARRSSALSARRRSIPSRTCATCARSSRRSTESPPPPLS